MYNIFLHNLLILYIFHFKGNESMLVGNIAWSLSKLGC